RRSRLNRWRENTSTSIAPRLRAPPRRVLLVAQLIVAALVLFFIGRTLVAQWNAFRGQPLETRLSWGPIVASGVVVLLSYAVLIQTWRTMLRGGASPGPS